MGSSGVRTLVQLLADAWLIGHETLAGAASYAPGMSQRLQATDLDVAQFEECRRLLALLALLGDKRTVPPQRDLIMVALDAFREHTRPDSWPQAALWVTLTAGVMGDFALQMTGRIPNTLHQTLFSGSPAWRLQDFGAREVQAALQAEHGVQDTLALYGRRMSAEAVSQAERILGENPALTGTLAGTGQDADEPAELASASTLLESLVTGNARRMAEFGLVS